MPSGNDIVRGGYAIIADASNTSKLAYIGKAVAAGALNASISVQKRGSLTET